LGKVIKLFSIEQIIVSNDLGEAGRNSEKLGESWGILENLGGGRAFVNSFWGAFAKRPYIM